MATTSEQAEAYAYENRRRTTSLIRGTDEARHDPRRRLNRGLGGGIAIGILIMAGFGIAGWLGGGRGPALPASGAVIAGDGDRYVVTEGVVHPALNLASALLVGGGQLTEVRQGVLNDAPRGLPVGIEGAPDALPGEGDLVTGDWTLCAIPAERGGEPTGTALYISVPGVAPPEGTPSTTLLAETEDGRLWLLTEGRRHLISEGVRGLLDLQRAEPQPLPADIIATVPEGPEIEIPATSGDTGAAPAAGALPFEASVGDLAHTEGAGQNPQYFLVRPDGLLSISQVVHRLLSADAPADHTITSADAARATPSQDEAPGNSAWPDLLPQAQEPGRDQPVCISTPPGGQPSDTPWQATVHLPGVMPEPPDMQPVVAIDGSRLGEIDRIWIPTGSGVVVRATTSAGSGGTYTLVTDSGTAFPFASPDAVQRLRYTPGDAPSLPQSFVRLLPHGPVLDPEAAGREQRSGPADSADENGEGE
ncbi:type VII secretion protein EccB [Streptomyces avicenniae]|uniref:type VII secretion protein EccB n=1 Tax=Streptomyces avicenniae TaxID=500153 RepID=UPI00069AF95A|nr:type VII secretion protein EccB [Streptomyces avicenniae]